MNDIPSRRFLGIQALRTAAALLVVRTHATFYTSERLDSTVVTWGPGARGVDIFFVISGFVMICAGRKILGRPDGWKIFAQSRVVRIVPLYWFVTTLKVVILLLTAGFVYHARLSLATAASSYLFLPAKNMDGKIEPLVGVGWTLNFEMFFYLLLTLALFLRVNIFKFIGAVFFALAIASYFRQESWPPVAFYLDSVVLEFFFGMLIAKASMSGLYCPGKAAPWLLTLGFVLLLLPASDGAIPKALINGLPACLIVWSAASLGSLERFIPPFVLYLGEASYAIYLIHPFISPLPPTVMHRLHMNYPSISIVLGMACGVGLGCILHQFVEVPIASWLRGLLNARRGSTEVAVVR
jgi:exopolysaccharide production protein ExoZ